MVPRPQHYKMDYQSKRLPPMPIPGHKSFSCKTPSDTSCQGERRSLTPPQLERPSSNSKRSKLSAKPLPSSEKLSLPSYFRTNEKPNHRRDLATGGSGRASAAHPLVPSFKLKPRRQSAGRIDLDFSFDG